MTSQAGQHRGRIDLLAAEQPRALNAGPGTAVLDQSCDLAGHRALTDRVALQGQGRIEIAIPQVSVRTVQCAPRHRSGTSSVSSSSVSIR